MNKKQGIILSIITTIIVFILIFSVGWYVLKEQHKEFERCNEMYGEDNWVLNETTSTGSCKGYIGQCWECIEDSF